MFSTIMYRNGKAVRVCNSTGHLELTDHADAGQSFTSESKRMDGTQVRCSGQFTGGMTGYSQF